MWINALVASAGGQILENPEAPADEIKLGLETPAGEAAATIIGTIGKEGLGGPGAADRGRGRVADRCSRGTRARSWSTGRSSGRPRNAAVEDGTLDQSLLDDIGWALYPQVTEGSRRARRRTAGSTSASARSASTSTWRTRRRECIVTPEHQAQYFATNGNPPSNTDGLRRPGGRRRRSRWPTSSGSRWSTPRPRPQTPYYNEVSTGLQQTWHPPSAVDPETTPDGVDRPDHRRASRGAAAMTTGRRQEAATCATPQRRPAAATARKSEARLGWMLAGPAFVVMLAVTALPDPAGLLRLALPLPAHRPGRQARSSA